MGLSIGLAIHRPYTIGYAIPAPPSHPLRHPKYHLIESIRPSIEVHWGCRYGPHFMANFVLKVRSLVSCCCPALGVSLHGYSARSLCVGALLVSLQCFRLRSFFWGGGSRDWLGLGSGFLCFTPCSNSMTVARELESCSRLAQRG